MQRPNISEAAEASCTINLLDFPIFQTSLKHCFACSRFKVSTCPRDAFSESTCSNRIFVTAVCQEGPVISKLADVPSKVGLNTGGVRKYRGRTVSQSHKSASFSMATSTSVVTWLERWQRRVTSGEQNTWTTSCQGVSTSVFREDRFTSVVRVHDILESYLSPKRIRIFIERKKKGKEEKREGRNSRLVRNSCTFGTVPVLSRCSTGNDREMTLASRYVR